MAELINRMLSLDWALGNLASLATQPPHEIRETRIAAHALAAAFDAAEADSAPTTAQSGAEPGLLNAAEAASYLGVRESFVRVAGRRGDLASIQVGRYVRFERKALDDFARLRRRNNQKKAYFRGTCL